MEHEQPSTMTADVPLAQREALTLREAASLGFGSERTLRMMIRTERLRRCVLRIGARGIRLMRTTLVEELQAGN